MEKDIFDAVAPPYQVGGATGLLQYQPLPLLTLPSHTEYANDPDACWSFPLWLEPNGEWCVAQICLTSDSKSIESFFEHMKCSIKIRLSFNRFLFLCPGVKGGLAFFFPALFMEYSNSSKSHSLKPRKMTASYYISKCIHRISVTTYSKRAEE